MRKFCENNIDTSVNCRCASWEILFGKYLIRFGERNAESGVHFRKDKICIINLFEHSSDLEGYYMGARMELGKGGLPDVISNLIGIILSSDLT